jgi:UDP-4-amino-4,6-dideoxy-N-acetyl-beta-L-altrosamine transaminase
MNDFLPYSRQRIDEQDIEAVSAVLRSEWITQGPTIAKFEEAFAKKTGAKFAVALSNGTAALHLAYLAAGLKEGENIVTTPNTFVATANAALYCGGNVKFADIDAETGLIDAAKIEPLIDAKTKLIAPVDFGGCPADLKEIYALAKSRSLFVIQDACHSLGATYENSVVGDGKYADMTVFSFHPVKPITTGEGGAITTNDEALYKKLLRLRTHGISKENMSQNPGPWYYEMTELGFNFRLTDIQAALGLSQLSKLDAFVASRRQIAARYDEAFRSAKHVRPLKIKSGRRSGYHLYVVRIDFASLGKSRAQVMAELKAKNVGSQVHYIPVFSQPYYKRIQSQPNCPEAEKYYERALSIPIYPFMSDSDVQRVIDAMAKL